MSEERIFWQSTALPAETVADAVARFVAEVFGVERTIRWADNSPGEFRFVDGYWCYRITFGGGDWTIVRMDKKTPQAEERMKAKREVKREARRS